MCSRRNRLRSVFISDLVYVCSQLIVTHLAVLQNDLFGKNEVGSLTALVHVTWIRFQTGRSVRIVMLEKSGRKNMFQKTQNVIDAEVRLLCPNTVFQSG